MIKTILRLFDISSHDVYLAKSVKHTGWLLRAFSPFDKRIPLQPLKYSKILKTSDQDIKLSERLISSYHKSLDSATAAQNRSQEWEKTFNSKQRGLHNVLERRDPEELAQYLSKMLQSSIVFGIDTGDLYTGRNWRFHSLKLLDDLVSLAEFVGVVRAESGQGTIGHAFDDGISELVTNLERAIGQDIGAPQVAGAYGIFCKDRLFTIQSPEYIYVALKVLDTITKLISANDLVQSNSLNLVEIGAGYGGTANFIKRFGRDKISSYTIIDLPIVNVLQGYYLSKANTPQDLLMYGEEPSHYPSSIFRIYPDSYINDLPKADLLINQNSMPEIPLDIAVSYCEWAKRNVNMFYSYNHESLTSDRTMAVTTVPEVISKVSGFRRYSREISWVRPGYVEEVYFTGNKL